MMKAILLGLAAVVGSVVSCLVYLVIDIVFDLPLADYERDVWTEYGSRIFGAVGGIGGVVMGWTACVWINKPRMHVACAERDSSYGKGRSVPQEHQAVDVVESG